VRLTGQPVKEFKENLIAKKKIRTKNRGVNDWGDPSQGKEWNQKNWIKDVENSPDTVGALEDCRRKGREGRNGWANDEVIDWVSKTRGSAKKKR